MNQIDYEGVRNYPSLLNSAEIANPFLVLKDVFANEASAESVQEEIWEIFCNIIRPFYWMRLESPLVLYKSYKKLVRLIEAGYLISLIRPNHIVKGTFAKNAFEETDRESEEHVSKIIQINSNLKAYQHLLTSYHDYPLYLFQCEFYELFYESMNPTIKSSYVGTEYVIDTYHNISDMIETLFLIHQMDGTKEISKNEFKILEGFLRYGLEKEHATYYYYGSSENIFDEMSKTFIIDGLNEASRILNNCDYWRFHNNPANLLYLFGHLLFTVDVLWNYKDLLDDKYNRNIEWNIPSKVSEKLSHLTEKEKRKPIKLLSKMFKDKTLSQWHKELEEWKICALGIEKASYETNRKFDYLRGLYLKLLDVASITTYEPEFEL